jgi:hypothetical protein
MPRAFLVARLSVLVLLTIGCGSSSDPGPDAGVGDFGSSRDLSPTPPTTLADTQTLTTCLAVDGNAVYWADQAQGTRVMKVGLSGGAATVLATGGDKRTCVAIDAANAYYFSRDNDGGAGDTIWKVPLDGSGAASPVATNQHVKGSLVAEGGFVYFVTDLYGPMDMAFTGMDAIVRIPVGGGTSEVLFAGVTPEAAGLAVDADHLYFSDQTGVFARPKAGGSNTPFGMSSIQGSAFAVDGKHLVLVEVSAIGMGDLALYSLDGTGRVVLSSKLAASPLALDGSGVYAKQDNHLVRFALDGKSQTTLTTTAPRAIALDAGNIYFTDGASILKLAK